MGTSSISQNVHISRRTASRGGAPIKGEETKGANAEKNQGAQQLLSPLQTDLVTAEEWPFH